MDLGCLHPNHSHDHIHTLSYKDAFPLVSTVLLGATAINLGGNVLQKETWLPQIAAGELVIGFVLEEGKHHKPKQISTTAKATPP